MNKVIIAAFQEYESARSDLLVADTKLRALQAQLDTLYDGVMKKVKVLDSALHTMKTHTIDEELQDIADNVRSILFDEDDEFVFDLENPDEEYLAEYIMEEYNAEIDRHSAGRRSPDRYHRTGNHDSGQR